MRVKIISDGTRDGTQIVDATTNKAIGRVIGFELSHSVEKPYLTVQLEFVKVELDIEAEVVLPSIPSDS